MGAGHIEAQAEFSLLASHHSPFQSEEEEYDCTPQPSTPKRSFLGHDEDIYIGILMQCIEGDGIAEIDGLDEWHGSI